MTHYKAIDGTTYAYSLEGKGEPLVLLHGFTGTKETWQYFIEEKKSNYRILSIDMPGHGKTVAKQKVTMEEFVEDLHHLTRHLQFHSFHLLGYSFGGRSALSYALRYPDTIRTLILESASPGLATAEERENRMAKDKLLAEMIIEKGLKHFVAYWENIPLFATQKQLSEAEKMAIRNERLSQSAIGLAQSLLGMGTGVQASNWKELSSINFPLLLMVGSLDQKFVEINEAMAKEVETSELHLVEGAGHAIHVEFKAKFVKIVSDYIEKY
ncbi:MAG TPA: 2-succinyl-6-hydroxy-2,4-cyclohexadiene-1-carboxylate synthase [Pseudogracilibacillus sp.]|nr:2-succinyl-6-hydroxy-2,4-cyclohexadiene-1-carboxylate synthase [Pseudogracilibacillus sp.]